MDRSPAIEEGEGLRSGLELVKSVPEKHPDLLRPSARHFSMFKGQAIDTEGLEKGKYTLIRGAEDFQLGIYDKPLPCFGCGIGWFSVCVPLDVVLCHNFVFWKLLPQRPQGASRPCCFCNCCNGMFHYVVDHSSNSSILTLVMQFHALPRPL